MKNKKQTQSNKSHSDIKKWVISLATFGIIGVCAAVALPLALCNKTSADTTKVYTTDTDRKFLDGDADEAILTTKLNKTQTIEGSRTSYEVESSFNTYINTYKDNNNVWHARWNSSELRPAVNTTALIDTYVDGAKVTDVSLVLDKKDSPTTHAYTASLTETILRTKDEESVITVTEDGLTNITDDVTYQIPTRFDMYISTINKSGNWEIQFNHYPARPLSATINVLSKETTPKKLTEISVTLLPYQPAQVINASTPYGSQTIYNDDGDDGVTIADAINLEDIAVPNLWPIFEIDADITHTILIPVDFTCWVFGAADTRILTQTDDGTDAYGIIIANTKTRSVESAPISIVDANIFVSGSGGKSYGIYFNNSEEENVIIENDVIFSSNSTVSCGLYWNSQCDVTGNLTISNNVCVTESMNTESYGFLFECASLTDVNFINNVIKIQANGEGHGVKISNEIENSTINFEGNYIYVVSATTICDCFYLQALKGVIDISNNVLYASGVFEEDGADSVDICIDTLKGDGYINHNILLCMGGGYYTSAVLNYDLDGDLDISNNTCSINADIEITALSTEDLPVIPSPDDRNTLYWKSDKGCNPTNIGVSSDYFKNGVPAGNGEEVEFSDVQAEYSIWGNTILFYAMYTDDDAADIIPSKTKLINQLEYIEALTTNHTSKGILAEVIAGFPI